MNKYFLKRVFNKISTWVILLLHLLVVSIYIIAFSEWKPDITNNNDFFSLVFWMLIVTPFVAYTYTFSPLSWLPWFWIDDLAHETEKDGTDLFFLSTEAPTSRQQVFWRKVILTTSAFLFIYLVTIVLPLAIFFWKINFFSNFTWLQTLLFLTCNFLIIPLFFFVPWFIFLFSLASLGSVWYSIFKWTSRLSFILLILLSSIAGQAYVRGEEEGIGSKIIKLTLDCWEWLKESYLLLILAIVGITIALAYFTLFLAREKFEKKDLS